nr:mitofilin family membrane protein [uncultured Rhodopila sp.]
MNQADIGRLAARIDGLDAKAAEQTQVGGRLDGLSGRIEALSGRLQAALDAEKQQADRLSAQVAALEKNAGGLDSVSDHLQRVTRIQEASIALAAGRPVGDVPNAPPALSRFAHEAPPTEVQLRLLFAQSEKAAVDAKQPDDTSEPLIDRVWERAQNLVTVHRGEEVLVGNPASVTLGHAREALDSGDLKDAIATVETLKGQPRQAMAKWLAEAKSLEDARAALASLAGQT